jgi:hypothetical protein
MKGRVQESPIHSVAAETIVIPILSCFSFLSYCPVSTNQVMVQEPTVNHAKLRPTLWWGRWDLNSQFVFELRASVLLGWTGKGGPVTKGWCRVNLRS